VCLWLYLFYSHHATSLCSLEAPWLKCSNGQ
jgi:hypothetical protein